MDISINWLAVIIATVANMILGFAWYSPALFSRPWAKIVGFGQDEMKGRAVGPYVVMAILAFITSLAVAYFFNYMTYDYSVVNGIRMGLELGLGVLMPAVLSMYMFQRRPLALFFIDFGYRQVGLLIVAMIIGGMSIY